MNENNTINLNTERKPGGLYRNIKMSVKTADKLILVGIIVLIACMIFAVSHAGFTVTFNTDGGSQIDNQKVMYGQLVDIEENPVKNLLIEAQDRTFKFSCVSMGNPHAITIVEDVKNFNVERYGKIIEVDKHFPKRINVEFIQIIDRNHIKMRVWERGAGETLACGTGACASVVSCIINDLTDRKVTVELLGGNLEIEWNKEDNLVYMTGPAVTVFEGELT